MQKTNAIKRKPGNPAMVKGGPSLNPQGRRPGRETISKEVVEALRHSFHELGGAEYLLKIGQTDHKTFCALLGRVLPSEISATVTHQLVDLSAAMETANARIIQLQGEAIDITPESQKTADPKS